MHTMFYFNAHRSNRGIFLFIISGGSGGGTGVLGGLQPPKSKSGGLSPPKYLLEKYKIAK